MKTIDIADATASLAQYARANRRETLVVIRRGRPIAALMPVSTPADVESFQVSSSPRFQALIEESRRVNPRGRASARSRFAALAPVAPGGSAGSDRQAMTGIARTPGVCGGSVCVAGTRIAVWVLEGYRRLGWTESKILASYPTLRASDLVRAWAFADENRAEIDEEIRRNEEA
jgi:uncharacterized protein (DUF433 family)/antitoxin (DNA-binding transcriptional repressor) of toxin-antitoxin stability system